MAESDTEPKAFKKGGVEGDLGFTTRAGRIRVLEGLIGDLEGSIRPVLQRLQVLRSLVEQERDVVFMEERRALRARERTQAKSQSIDPDEAVASDPPPPGERRMGPEQVPRPEPQIAKAAAQSGGSRTQYSASGDAKSAV